MIETVSTSSVQSAALRASPQASASARSIEPVSKAEFFVSSRVRMDNLLDLAILEYRNADNGDVIRQYPSESQIRAFQRAAELETENSPEPHVVAIQVNAGSSEPAPPPPASSPAPAGESASDANSSSQSVIV